MNIPRLPLALTALSLLGACATNAPGDNMLAGAPAKECKAVAVYSAHDQIRNQVRGAPAAGSLAETEGVAGVARMKTVGEPRALRHSTPGDNVIDKTLRDC